MRCTCFSYLVWAADSHHKWGALGSAIWFELLIHTTNEAHLVQPFGLSGWFIPQMRCTWFSYWVSAADSHHKWAEPSAFSSFGLSCWISSSNEVHLVQLFGLTCWLTPQMRGTWFSYLVWAAESAAQMRCTWFSYLVWAADSHHKWGARGSAIWFELLIHSTSEALGVGSSNWFELLIHTTNEAHLVQLFGLSCWISSIKWGAHGSAIWFELLIHTTNEAHLSSAIVVWAADS